jgi:FSR family fosmidomycin resistance protein-like MFS transporter
MDSAPRDSPMSMTKLPDYPITQFSILTAISFSHLLNDMIQSVVPAIYPILKSAFDLSFAQIGLIAFTLQLTASLLQPIVGLYTDRRPTPRIYRCCS